MSEGGDFERYGDRVLRQIEHNTAEVAKMSGEVKRIADVSEAFMRYHGNTIPLKVVLIIIAVIVLAFGGAEALKILHAWIIPVFGRV